MFLTGWQLSIDETEVRLDMPGLYWSSVMLKYVLLAQASKDIAIQLTVWRMVYRNTWETSLTYHFIGWAFCLPFKGAITTWTIICLVANKEILDGGVIGGINLQDSCQQWYRVTINFVFYALVYKLVHIFPLSCIFMEARGYLIDDQEGTNELQSLELRKQRAAEAMSLLTSFKFVNGELRNQAASYDSKNSANVTCVICFQGFKEDEWLTVLPCDTRHEFHRSCLHQWLERDLSCPVCR